MIVEKLQGKNFRNLEHFVFQPCKNVNIIYGDNGQGKTNMLEAIWLFTGSKSFRGAKEGEMVSFHQPVSQLELQFFSEGRSQKAKLLLGEKKQVLLNGVAKNSASALSGSFHSVVFSPTQLALVKEGPEGRRRWIDAALCQIKRSYRALLVEYQRVVLQRNLVLKDISRHPGLEELLTVWEERMVQLGSRIIQYRKKYLTTLSPLVGEIYSGISKGREKVVLRYSSTVPASEGEELPLLFHRTLLQNRREDISKGITSVGPHRDDLSICMEGKPARLYASQGQQRSVVLAMKLSEAALLKQVTHEMPVILLDDIMSELDTSRQDYILHHLEEGQVFITCCEPSQVMRLQAGSIYRMTQGSMELERE